MPRGRPKKATAENLNATPIPVEAVKESVDTSAPDKSLEEAKGKFTQVLTIGLLPDGNIDIATNNPNYAVLQWLINRAQFELLSHEKLSYVQKMPAVKAAG